jgi:ABC-type nitrate/sulfonate/bicarbonate transport system substrate-binding protein
MSRRSSSSEKGGLRVWVGAAASAVLALTLTACSSSPSASSSTTSGAKALSDANVNLGIADTPEGALLIKEALAQGYWKQLGLTVNVESVPTGPAQLAGIAGGSLQLAQSGPSTTMVPIQQGKAQVQFIAATETAIPWQLVISKSWADAHGFTQQTNPEQILPKLKGATFAGVASPTDSIATVQGYALAQYGVTTSEVKTDYLGSPAAMFADLAAGRADAYVDVLGQTFQAVSQYGAIYVNLASLKKLPYISESIPSFFTAAKSFEAAHPDTLTAFVQGLWKAWIYVKNPSHESAIISLIQKEYPGTSTAAAEYDINFFVKYGMWMSKSLWTNTVALANTTLTPPLTVTYSQVANEKFERAAIKNLGITPPRYS